VTTIMEGRAGGLALAALMMGGLAAGGGDDGEVGPVFQAIETVQYDPSLGIDLADFTRLDNGVFIDDVTVGAGDEAIFGVFVTVDFTAWIADGTEIAGDPAARFIMGNNQVPLGMEDGILNMLVGGTRRVLVPPNRGLGGIEELHDFGNVIVPAGSVLIYEITLVAVEPL